MMGNSLCLLVALALLGVMSETLEEKKKDVETGRAEDELQKVFKEVNKQCRKEKTSECVKFEFFTLVERVLPPSGHPVLPGVLLTRSDSSTFPPPQRTLTESSSREKGHRIQEVNQLLADRLVSDLGSWTLSVAVFGNSTLQRFNDAKDLFLAPERRELRSSKGYYYNLWRYVGSTLLTLVFTIFSVLITKSLTISTIALLLSVLGLLRGLGGGDDGGGGHHSSPVPAYRSPAVYALPPLQAAANNPQYVDDQEDNPYVYVNRKAWRSGRGGQQESLLKSHW